MYVLHVRTDRQTDRHTHRLRARLQNVLTMLARGKIESGSNCIVKKNQKSSHNNDQVCVNYGAQPASSVASIKMADDTGNFVERTYPSQAHLSTRLDEGQASGEDG